ncbi:hypothetical protein SFC57_09705 [Niallia circulans]|uniref:hypothetical protein n=1 Tax=Niallia circulans TaxID=1397 RepID=UPI00397E2EB1
MCQGKGLSAKLERKSAKPGRESAKVEDISAKLGRESAKVGIYQPNQRGNELTRKQTKRLPAK